jgi:hypothetical protein
VSLDAEIKDLTDKLGRPIRAEVRWGSWRIVQRCLVCDEEVVSVVEGDQPLRDTLFTDYDAHRCGRELNVLFGTDAELDALYARTESESLRLAERAAVVDDAELRTRLERESELLAIWASWLSREATQRTA